MMQLSKQERDYNFSVACNDLRETTIKNARGIKLVGLGHSLVNTGVDLKDCKVHSENIIFYAIDIFAPAVLKFILTHGATLDVTNTEGKTPLEYSKDTLKRTLDTYSETSVTVALAKEMVSLIK